MGFDIASAAYDTGTGLLGAGLGILMQKANDKRQLKQQQKLQAMQIGGQKEMMDYGQQKQMEMWQNTSYPAQMEMLKKAGLNPGLMYGMGGGGGQTTGSASGNVTGGTAPSGGGEVGMGITQMMQLRLLNAQKENIEADTENKRAGARSTTATAEGQGLENALTAWLQGTDLEGNLIGDDMGKSVRGQQEIQEVKKARAETQFKLDENQREQLKNNAVMNQIGADIALMQKKGLSEDEIYKNLKKTGQLLDAEIEWNKMDFSGNPGKFIWNLIKMLVKPR